MSASREKRLRKQQRAVPVATEKKPFSWDKFFTKVLVIGLALLFATMLFLSTGIAERNLTALEFRGERVSVAEYNYNMGRGVVEFGSWVGQNIDLRYSLASQGQAGIAASGIAHANRQLHETLILVALAHEAGMELSEENRLRIDAEMEAFETAIREVDNRPNRFLRQLYGRGVDLNTVRSSMERQFLANQFREQWNRDQVFTQEQYDDEYEENQDDYDVVTLMVYRVAEETRSLPGVDDNNGDDVTESDTPDLPIPDLTQPGASDEDDGEDEEDQVTITTLRDDALAAVRRQAEAFVNRVNDEDDTEAAFIDEVLALQDDNAEFDAESVFRRGLLQDDINILGTATIPALPGDEDDDDEDNEGSGETTVTVGQWAFAAGAREGNIAIFTHTNPAGEDDETVTAHAYVVRFVSRDKATHTAYANLRIITVPAERTAGADPTEEQVTAAYEEIEDILAQFEAGDATEDIFAALARDISGDSTGGRLDQYRLPYQAETELDQWITDSARRAGDVAILPLPSPEGSDIVPGYALVYFREFSELDTWQFLVREQLLQRAYHGDPAPGTDEEEDPARNIGFLAEQMEEHPMPIIRWPARMFSLERRL